MVSRRRLPFCCWCLGHFRWKRCPRIHPPLPASRNPKGFVRVRHCALAPLCARAHASVQPVSLILVLLAGCLLRFATRSQPLLAPKMARYSHHQPCCYVCVGQSPPYNPHRHTSLLHPTLWSNGCYPECARLQLVSPNRFGSHSG
jgi:hypothetical protein